MEDNKIIIYTTVDGQTKIDVRLEDETLWLTQAQMCELYQTSKSNVSEHIKHIFEEGELEENSVVRKFRTTASDGKSYMTTFYNCSEIPNNCFRREILYDHILQSGYDNSSWLSYQVRHSHPFPSMGHATLERIYDKRIYLG